MRVIALELIVVLTKNLRKKHHQMFKIGGGWKVSPTGEMATNYYLYTYAEFLDFSVKMNLERIFFRKIFLIIFLLKFTIEMSWGEVLLDSKAAIWT